MLRSRFHLVAGGFLPAALLMLCLGGVAGPASAAILNVPAPYATIQDAITAAAPGDTIVVAAGYYEENDAAWRDLHIDKSLNLVGAGSGQTIVGLSPGKTNGVEIYGTALAVRIEGMTFTKRTGQSVASGFNLRVGEVASTFTKLLLRDVEVAYGAGRNVFIDGNGVYQDITVENCSFHHSGAWGFSLRGIVDACTITNSAFEWNGTSDLAHGIGFDIDMPIAVGRLDVTGGSFSHNKAKGINLVKTANATFTGIAADYNSGAPGGGFGVSLWEWVGSSSELSFANSSFSNNSTDGFLFGTEGTCSIDDVSISGCRLNGNGRHGVLLYRYLSGTVTGVRVTDCDLSGNSGKGVAVSGFTVDVDASGNWWGSAAPATVAGKVTSHVDYTPWLGYDADLGGHSPGFEGDYSTLWVDDDSPQTTGGRIQEGVDLVSGSTVNVAAGNYEEQVKITEALTLDGAGIGQTTIQSPAAMSKFFTTSVNNYPVVYAHGTDGVTVRDLTVDGLGRGNTNYRFIGIGYYDAGGSVTNCEVKDVRDTPIGGGQHGVGIYALANLGTARTVAVGDCDMHGYQKNAMALSGANLTATVNGCDVTGYGPATFIAQNGIQISGGAQGSIGATEGNTISGHSYSPHDWAASGILVYSLGGPVTVRNNTLTNNSESIYCFDGSVTIKDNAISVTTAGTGVHDYWAVICDPGGAGPMPAASPFGEEETPKDGRATFTYTVNRNTIVGDDGSGSVGLDVWCDGTDQAAFTAGQNQIRDFDYGVNVDASGTGLLTSVSLNWNAICDNVTYGMYNDNASTGIEVDAENNWWGDAAGPETKAGNRVSPFVDYDPWIGKDGGENIVVVNDPEYLTTTQPVKTVSVDYLGGGSGLVYGYSVKFSWDGTKVSTAANKVLQGTLLSSQGATQFFKHVSGTNEITVDCVLLGDKPGVPGPGTMFTIEFTGLASGTSPVDVTVIKVRDKYNHDLTGFYPDDGELIVDLTAPTVTNVFIENVTLAHTDDYVKDSDDLKVTAKVWDDDPAFVKGNIRADLLGLGGGGSVEPDTYTDSIATWIVPSVTCAPANGKVTVTVTATDPIGNTASGSDDILADNIPPFSITGFAASPHHQRVALAWDDPSVLDTCYYGVLVRYDSAGDYPEYDALGSYPATPVGGDGNAFDQTGVVTSGNHNIVSRDIYYYTVFAYDWALNYGPAAGSAEDRAANYWLGDVDANTGPGGNDYDGDVDFDDISVLSNAYWLAGPVWPENECDVGPTEHGGPFDIPQPDEAINFEDLMVFAMNFNVVGPAMKGPGIVLAGKAEAGPATLKLVVAPGAGSAENEMGIALVLGGNDNAVKGAGVVVRYDPERLVFSGLAPSSALVSEGVLTFVDATRPGEVRFDWAVLGAGRAVRGTGELATIRFDVVDGGDVSIALEDARIRDAQNGSLAVGAEGLHLASDAAVPQSTRLGGAWPNPFNPSTAIRFDLNRAEHVTVGVFDPQGRLVRALVDEVRPAGRHEVVWNGADGSGRPAGSGAYLVRMRAGAYQATTKITLVR